MIRTIVRRTDGTIQTDVPVMELPGLLSQSEITVWIDLDPHELEEREVERLLQEQFQFHPLAVDDALRETHMPRVDDWHDALYVVLHSVRFDHSTRRIHTPELDIFLRKNLLVTYHVEAIPAVEAVMSVVVRDAQRMSNGPDNLLYQICDHIVAEYMPLAEQLDDWIDEIEHAILTDPSSHLLTRILRQKRRLIRLRRSLSALREVFNKLARDNYAVIDAADRVYFRDVYDHTVRLYDIVESMRDLVSGTLDTYLSMTSNRTNEVMKTLTITSVIFMPISFLASFFGMNFFADEFALHPDRSLAWLFWPGLLLTISLPPAMYLWMRFRRWV